MRIDPFAGIYSVPEHLHETDDDLAAWGRWCNGRPRPGTSPMFRLFRRSHARGEYGAQSPQPATDPNRALLVERHVRTLPELSRDVLRGWYVYNMSPARIARRLAIRRELLGDELHRARLMVRNLLAKSGSSSASSAQCRPGVFVP